MSSSLGRPKENSLPLGGTARSGSDLYVDWNEYHRLIEQLCLQIHQSDWRFDSLLCLARGGRRESLLLTR